MTGPALAPRPAATLILLRAGAGGLETLMLQRTQSAVFLGGAYVFPGGALDASDAAARRVLGLTQTQANQRLGLTGGALAYYVAAVRECFEEAGVLLACDANGYPVPPARAEKLMAERHAPFLELLEREDLYV
ncbi:MAG TPA: NUDIX hydrolase, partial [Burkholderiales bacterium]